MVRILTKSVYFNSVSKGSLKLKKKNNKKSVKTDKRSNVGAEKNTFLKPTDDVLFRTGDDHSTLIINVLNSDLFSLNASGTFIWSLVDGSRSVAGICEVIQSVFPSDSKAVEETKWFLSEAEKKGLLVKIGDPDKGSSSTVMPFDGKWVKPTMKKDFRDLLVKVAASGH